MYVSWNVNGYKILSLVDRANKSEIANFESWAFEFSSPFHKKKQEYQTNEISHKQIPQVSLA